MCKTFTRPNFRVSNFHWIRPKPKAPLSSHVVFSCSLDIFFQDYDTIDYSNHLREGILEAYTSIVHGLQEGQGSQKFDQYVGAVIELIDFIVKDEHRNSGVINAACGVVG